MHADCKHRDNSTLQAVAKDEGGSTAFFHVERDALQTTHVEEGLVLDGCKAWVMEESAVHKVALLEEVVLVLLHSIIPCEFSVVEIVRVLHDFNRIITSLRI